MSVCCQMAKLTHDKFNDIIGQVMAGCSMGANLTKEESTRSQTVFHHSGLQICHKTFCSLIKGIGCWRFKDIKAG